jgi:flagellar biosynthesis protein FlhA
MAGLSMPDSQNPIGNLFRHSDVVVAAAMLMIVVMMVIPVPTLLLDLLLTFNLTLALLIMLVTMYTTEPLQFSAFPAMLLVATLFRLALNVSSTRLILLHGNAGQLIAAFGEFVVGGNPVVGFVIFIILVIIQFMVITRGAERVAEVAARFTLDAMPGKQMSIDADLNAGLISEQEARQRRREVEKEADFYGAMDGASKFVKGDAIAGIIITIINIIGGLIIGMVQRGQPFESALQEYTLLTVGDGLVSQLPALLISTATGIMVTRAASGANLGSDLVNQIFSRTKVLKIVAAALLLLGLLPGLPSLPFFLLALLIGFPCYLMSRAEREAAELADNVPAGEREIKATPENVLGLLPIDPLEIELGYGLIPLGDAGQGGDLLDRIVAIRKQFTLDLGLIVPLVRIRDNLQLKPNQYTIKIKGTQV